MRARKGKGIFTFEDIRGCDRKPKNLLHELSKKNWILKIKKGLYMIAPLEAGELGARSYTVHSFVIAFTRRGGGRNEADKSERAGGVA